MVAEAFEQAKYPSLIDRGVIITGGATGIGAAFVAQFAKQGARVAFLDLDEGAGRALAQSLCDSLHSPVFVGCDLTDCDALAAAMIEAQRAVGACSVLINNAANDGRHSFAETTPARFDDGIAVNLRHQFFAAQAVVPQMRTLGGGSIICLGSTGWMIKNEGYPVYATAKSAIHGLVNGLARELGRDRIRVNALVPGWVITEKQERLWLDGEGEAEIARAQCLPGHVLADDIARMALFLAADDSRMCTGKSFVVDGGWT